MKEYLEDKSDVNNKFKDIMELEKRYFRKKKHSSSDGHRYLELIYKLKKQYILNNNEKALKVLNNFESYVQHDINRIVNINSSLLSLIATIFLPLSFIVGFFGMNFKSMGCPTLKTGILNFKYGETMIFFMSFICIILIVAGWYYREYNAFL